jgi:HK97 family phage major capsid protein
VPAQNADFVQVIATNFAGTEWLAETGTRNNTATPSLARVKPPSGGLSAVAPISNWLLNDSFYDAAAFVEESIGQGIGLAESAAFISGDTVHKPSGILTSPIAAGADSSRAFGTLERLASGYASTLDLDGLINLLYALAPQYRARAAFVMNPSTVSAVRKIKTTTNEYVWSPSAAAGQPATLLGVPCLEDVNMPTVGSNAYAVLCGDFTAGYTIIDIGPTMLIRDPFTSKGNTLIYVEKRIGGCVTDSNAIKVMQIAAT